MKISGSILSNEMKTIPDVNISALGTTFFTKTNKDGKFTIDVPGQKTNIKISHAAYETITVTADYFNSNSYLELKIETLKEIVVVNNNAKPKTDNTMWWILGLIGAGVVYYVATNKKPPTRKPSLRKPRIQPTKVLM